MFQEKHYLLVAHTFDTGLEGMSGSPGVDGGRLRASTVRVACAPLDSCNDLLPGLPLPSGSSIVNGSPLKSGLNTQEHQE